MSAYPQRRSKNAVGEVNLFDKRWDLALCRDVFMKPIKAEDQLSYAIFRISALHAAKQCPCDDAIAKGSDSNPLENQFTRETVIHSVW